MAYTGQYHGSVDLQYCFRYHQSIMRMSDNQHQVERCRLIEMFDGNMFYRVSADLMVIDFLLLGGLNKYVALKGAFFNFISFMSCS